MVKKIVEFGVTVCYKCECVKQFWLSGNVVINKWIRRHYPCKVIWCQWRISVQLVQLRLNMWTLGQTDAGGVLVIFALKFFDWQTGYFFKQGSFTEHWAALPQNRGGKKDLHAILFVFVFALASCEVHFMTPGELMCLSCLRSSLWGQHVFWILFWTHD